MGGEPTVAATTSSASLQSLVVESGRSPEPRLNEFARLASAVQRQRYTDSVSDTDLVTRSTALWVLTQLDPDLETVLRKAGLDHARLGRVLSISGALQQSQKNDTEPTDANLHLDFTSALRTYLATLQKERRVVSLADLATAILRSGSGDSRGLLPSRLNEHGFNVADALSGLSGLTAADPAPDLPSAPRSGSTPPPEPRPAPAPPPEAIALQLSETMRGVARELSATSGSPAASADLTAFDIATAIARRHPEYAGGSLGAATLLAPPDAHRMDWEGWRDSVAGLYDRGVLTASGHKRLDGRLFLAGLGGLDPGLRSALDTAGAWALLLVEVDDEVVPTGSPLRPFLQDVRFRYGYSSDRADGLDQLGVQGEVNAVCEVITDPKVLPPLAIGLFGDWGTGKSFFMERMRERVAHLTAQPSAGGVGGVGSGTLPLKVVQIRFNAWHYADTSLWASLAVEIFERLADPEPVGEIARALWLRDRGDSGWQQRQELLTQLQTYRDAKAALQNEGEALKQERAAVEIRHAEATAKRQQAVKNMSVTDVAGELARDPEVGEALKNVASVLGFEPAAEEVGALAAELRTTAGYLQGVWRLVQHKTWAVALAAGFVVLTLMTLALVMRGGTAWLASLATAASSVVTAIVAAAKVLRPAAEKLNLAVDKLQSARGVVSERAAQLRLQRTKEERSLEVQLAELDDVITGTTRQMAELDEKIAATQAGAEALAVGRRLYDFLADRAAGYQKHQGVVGMLHRDFRLLDAQLRAYHPGALGQRAEPKPLDSSPRPTPADGSKLPHIDRVILYIDDLDRCPPAKVLEVLEAVHLLLALELFVVVVGVDPRWLQRSLRHQYRDLVTTGDPSTDAYLRVMPIEYLEKIFQIPLTLPAMEPRAYAQLISSLGPESAAPPKAPPPSTQPPSPADGDRTAPPTSAQMTHRATTNESPGGDRAPIRAPLGVEAGSSASGDPVGPRIDLTPAEIRFAQTLGALVATPRAAKRLMNTYRLIRATQHVGSRSRFLGAGLEANAEHPDGHQPGDYQAVLTLLAVAAGYPTMADRLIVALQEDAAVHNIETWPSFVAELAPHPATGPGKLVPKDLAKHILHPDEHPYGAAHDELATWTNLHAALAAAVESNQLRALEPYRRWCSIAARFSFTV